MNAVVMDQRPALRFEIPAGVETGIALVQVVRTWEGSHETISAGAVAFADWIIEDPERAGAALYDPLCPLRDRLLNRVIAGTVLPGEAHGEWLGRVTSGRVTAQMFRRSFVGAVPELEAEPVSAPEQPAVPHPRDFGAVMLCAMPGPLGTIPRGPMFEAIADPMVTGEFALIGMGIGLRLDVATAGAMKRALEDGVEQIAADRLALAGG